MARLGVENLEQRQLMAADFIGDWVDMGCPNDVIARDPDLSNSGHAIFSDGFDNGQDDHWRSDRRGRFQVRGITTLPVAGDVLHILEASLPADCEEGVGAAGGNPAKFGPLWDFDRAAVGVNQDTTNLRDGYELELVFRDFDADKQFGYFHGRWD